MRFGLTDVVNYEKLSSGKNGKFSTSCEKSYCSFLFILASPSSGRQESRHFEQMIDDKVVSDISKVQKKKKQSSNSSFHSGTEEVNTAKHYGEFDL